MTEQIKSSGTTITGFSKSGFGCCARQHLCQMGKGTCLYAEKDPEVPTLCAAYQRNHGKPQVINVIEKVEVAEKVEIVTPPAIGDDLFSIFEPKLEQKADAEEQSTPSEEKEELSFSTNGNGQLSLF